MKKLRTKRSSKTAKQGDDAPTITRKLLKKSVLMPPITQFASAKEYFDYFYAQQKGSSNKVQTVKSVSLALEPNVLDWFKEHTPNYQTSINHVLKHYVLSHEAPR